MPYLGNTPAEAYTSTVKNSFNGDGSTTDFTLSQPSTTNNLRVVVENVVQDPTVAYTVSGTTLTFTSAPPTGTANIYAVHLGPATMTAVPPAEINEATTYTSDLTVQGDLTVDTDTLYVDATNDRVGIGTAVPDDDLHIKGATPAIKLEDTDGSYGFISANADNLILGADEGNVGASSLISFKVDGSEAARIDSSQRLLVGKTSGGSISTFGNELSQTYAMHSRDDGVPLFVGRSGTSGDMIAFYNGTTSPSSHHGGIRTDGRIIIYDRFAGGIRFGASASGVMQLTPQNAAGTGGVDNQHDIGASSLRWDDIFATSGTVNTSDATEKQQISSLNNAEITAAKAISKLFKTYKWNSSVETKGDAARTHAGVVAQEVKQAMTDVGLDATKYGFFCSDTWWEVEEVLPATDEYEEHTVTHQFATLEEAPAGATERTRLGIRYPELLSFIGAATEQRLTSIEARLAALENA